MVRWGVPVPVPVRVMVALAAGFLALAVRVAVVVCPAVVGANWTVTTQDLRGPTAVAVQVLPVTENVDDPVSETLNAPVADPPELVSVKV
jgi:hypothetical protein